MTGPPAAGKSTWVLQRAGPGDIVVDYDRLALALTGVDADPHDHGWAVHAVTRKARRAAIAEALHHRADTDVYVIHSTLTDQRRHGYERLGATVVTVDPGSEVVLARCASERPAKMITAAAAWYEARPREGRGDHSRQW